MKNKYKLITKSEFARQMNISPQRVYSLIKKGMIRPRKDGKINFDLAKKTLENNRATSPKTMSTLYADARTKHEMIRIENAKLDLKKKGES